MDCLSIRQIFVNYYLQDSFQLLPRAPMMHPSIPMSYVMSAGLEQVETVLAGDPDRAGNRFVLVQDCFRHFDINSVGTDTSHLSLFEMAGAFIFGSCDRLEPLRKIWDLVTRSYGIPLHRIWVSYFGGGKIGNQDLPKDQETYEAWREIGVPEKRLIGLGPEHNYWMQGGSIFSGQSVWLKCGAHTEIFFDRGADKCGSNCLPGCRCGRFVELSNTLFISDLYQSDTETFSSLSDPFAETVIGVERMGMVLQEKPLVFDIDRYSASIQRIHQLVNNTDEAPSLIRQSEYVIADHLRALCVLIADNAPPPGKNGRARIIRVLIRNVLTRQIILGISLSDLLSSIVPLFLPTGDNGPKVKQKIIDFFFSEQHKFHNTLEKGKRELDNILAKKQLKILDGAQILFLEKKKGLPFLITESFLKERGIVYSKADYQNALNHWRRTVHH